MSQTHHSAQWPARAIGILAALRVFPRVAGSGAPAPARRLALALGLVVLAAGALTASPALAARGHVFSGSFGREGAGHGQFNWPDGVAVNEATGDVYVLDRTNDSVQYFTATGAYIGEFNGSGTLAGEKGKVAGGGKKAGELETGKFSEPTGLAIDNSTLSSSEDPSKGDVYVLDTGHEVVDKFTASGEYVGQITTGAGGVPLSAMLSIAVGVNGALWLTTESDELNTYTNATLNELNASHTAKPEHLIQPGLAIDSDDNVYVGNKVSGHEIDKLNSEGGSPTGPVGNAESATAVAVETSTNAVYIDNEAGVIAVSSTGAVLDSFGSEQLVEIPGSEKQAQPSGIAVDAANGVVYVANPAEDDVDMYSLEQQGAPLASGETVSDVTSTSATFDAQVNPSGFDTHYYYEYCIVSTSKCSDTPAAPGVDIGAEFGTQTLAPVTVGNLTPGTEYAYRLVATNSVGEASKATQAFTTQSAGGPLTLPDGRQWELVSPPVKNAGLITPEYGILQASDDGSAISYSASSPIGEDIGGDVSPGANQELSIRGPDGWSTRDINTPHAEAIGDSGTEGGEYRLFNSSLSLAALEPNNERATAFGETPLDPEEAPERTLYRSNLAGSYTPLVRDGNVPASTHYGYGELQFIDGTANLEHIILSSSREIALTSTSLRTKVSLEAEAENFGLYEWTEGSLQLVSVLPANEDAGEAAFYPQLGYDDASVRNAISANGSRVVWTGEVSPGQKHLYMRDIARQETIRLDAPEAGANGGKFEPVFQDASEDGSRIFFTDQAALTNNSTASENHPDLYVFETAPGGGLLSGKLHDLSAMGIVAGSGETSSVQGDILGSSEEGTVVYYVANGVLGEHATPGKCDMNEPSATCSLYMQRFNTETGSWLKPTYMTTLSASDYPSWGNESPFSDSPASDLGKLTASVSQNGRFVAFTSDRSLTGYDNLDAVSGAPDQEVYLYDSQIGGLVCASCNPSGARPHGIRFSPSGKYLVEPLASLGLLDGNGIAGSLPASGEIVRGETDLYQARYLSNEGRLFFNSPDALVPQDTNGKEDVYEYEPPESADEAPANDSCGIASVTYSSRSDGCVSLISSGTSSAESAFLDASGNGDDVFFLTKSQLAREDVDDSYDVYDAHVCTSASPCTLAPAETPPPCESGDACRPAPSPEPAILGAPASATFSGEGNVSSTPVVAVKTKAKPLTRAQKLADALKACRKKIKGKRAVCTRQARKKYAPVTKRKAKSRKEGN